MSLSQYKTRLPRTHANSERLARAVSELRGHGFKQREVAEMLGVSRDVVAYHCTGRSKAAIRAGVSGSRQ